MSASTTLRRKSCALLWFLRAKTGNVSHTLLAPQPGRTATVMPRIHHYTAQTVLLFVTMLHAAASGAQQTDGWPDWLIKAMAREANNLEPTAVSAANGRYRFQLAGKATAAVAVNNGWSFESDIGAEMPLECHIVTGETDLAELVANLAEAGIAARAEAIGGPVDNRSIHSVDAGAIAGAPFLALEWIYTIGKAPNALLGFTKVRAATNGGIVQACSHNLVGYRETFSNAFAEFVRTAQLPKDRTPPYYEEIAVHSLGDQRVGVTLARFSLDEIGNSRINTTLSSLVPVAADKISYEDSSTISSSTPEGLLIDARTSNSQSGELLTDLQLSRKDNNDWVVRGTYRGTIIDTVINGSARPLSEVGQILTTRELFSGDAAEVSFPVWLADADPTRVAEGKILRDDARVPGQGTLILGPMTFTARFDEFGAITQAEMQAEAATISIERVWSRGTPH
ncbi:MAG: hypothetical protein ACO22K_05305 [Woeseiaceae bacterium]